MTDDSIKAKALALLNEVSGLKDIAPYSYLPNNDVTKTLCRAIEQHEAFKQEVSDAVGDTLSMLETHCDAEGFVFASNQLLRFIIPKPKPDPLVEVLLDMELSSDQEEGQHDAKWLRLKLDALGFEIREKGQ
jgi:hypothetical protein